MSSVSAAWNKDLTAFAGRNLFSALVSECRADLERRRAELRIPRYGWRSGHTVIALETPSPAKIRELEILIAAAERLLDVKDRNTMFRGVHEVLANLLGTEHFAIYEKKAAKFNRVAFSGHTALIPTSLPSVEEAEALAHTVVPLTFGDRVVGLLVVFTFLPQKGETWAGDTSLLRFVQRVLGVGIVALPGTHCVSEVVCGT